MASQKQSNNDAMPFQIVKPKITQDPRFRAGCKMIESGRDGAIDVFGLLLEEARTKYGEVSIETAPAYFEYGKALFREASRQQPEENEEEEGEGEEEEDDEEDHDKKPAAVKKENENDNSQEDNGQETEKTTEKESVKEEEQEVEESDVKQEADEAAENQEGEEEAADSDKENEEQDDDDVNLALEVMETAYAILDTFVQTATQPTAPNQIYLPWAKRHELPRVLSNLGDLLSFMERHADAADAYTRGLALREENLKAFADGDRKNISWCLQELKERRCAVEAAVLVATELLDCPPDVDVVTTEAKALLVKAAERTSFAEGYYHQARDQLQDAVLLMAELASRCEKSSVKQDFLKEKEDVCFASVMVMGVGEKLSQIKEGDGTQEEDQKEPVKKRAKR
ncbi:expressed unknown protein [Seminavis robusta]|uniref:Tetratricopeptide SHNi-TPR domain-containing protein n=1 Tax=Seminavis robusta TaxID=568900 RepID=A0A9N8HYZ1_9STRA|nr:expressed unknown protein [Seminavis robusta]|eukprot:Sro3128_g344300.1 n/a (398) ;mRNA; f:3548-4741